MTLLPGIYCGMSLQSSPILGQSSMARGLSSPSSHHDLSERKDRTTCSNLAQGESATNVSALIKEGKIGGKNGTTSPMIAQGERTINDSALVKERKNRTTSPNLQITAQKEPLKSSESILGKRSDRGNEVDQEDRWRDFCAVSEEGDACF